MAFTASSTVSNVIISVLSDTVKSTTAILDGDDDGTVIDIDTTYGYPSSGSQNRTDLEILQEIYNSDDGFQDTDGGDITVDLRGRYEGTPEGLSENGWWNPLHADGEDEYLRYLDGIKAASLYTAKKKDITFNTDGTVSEESRVGNVPVEDTPTSDNTMYSLSAWTADQSGTSIAFSVRFDYEDGIMPDDLDEHTDMIAFATWLESIRTDGDSVGTDLGETTSYNNREYTFAQTDGGDDIVVDNARIILAQHTDDVMFKIWIYLERDSGAEINTADVRAFLATTEVSVPVTEGIHKPPFGSVEIPTHASEIVFPNQQGFGIINGSPYARTRVLGKLRRKEINSAVGVTVNYSDLEDVAGASGTKWIPPVSIADTIHFTADEASGGRLRYPSPPNLVGDEGTHVIHRFHNKHALLSFIIQDWDGNQFSRVTTRQFAEFQMTLEEGGDGELIKRHLPRRRLVRVGSNVGDLTDSLGLRDAANSVRYRLFSAPTTPTYIDSDGFTIPNQTTVPSGRQEFEDFTAYTFKDLSQVDWDGELEIRFAVSLELTSGVATPNDSGLALMRQRGTDPPDILLETQQSGQAVADGVRTYNIADIFEVQEGDVIFIAYRHPDTGSTSWSSFEIREFVLQAFFNPDIVIPYTA